MVNNGVYHERIFFMISAVYHACLSRVAPILLLTLFSVTSASAESCLKCHDSILKQFNANSHHIQGVEASDRHCYACHWEATEEGTVNGSYHRKDNSVDLVVWEKGKRPVDYQSGITAISFIPAAIGGKDERKMVSGITVHCLSCHNDAARYSTPFAGDPNSPARYAWDRESIASRYSSKKTTSWGKYSTATSNRKKQVTKAFSAHGNAAMNQGGWREMTGYDGDMPLTRGGGAAKNVECFDCHNSHGSTASGVTTSYSTFYKSRNGGILKQTASGQSGYKSDYQPSINSYTRSKNPFNSGAGLCFDCHETAVSGATPWGYNSTFGAAKPIMGYKDTAGFGDGLKGSSARYGNRQGRGEISSSHLKAGTPLHHQTSEQINGLCTPCHDPHGISRTLGENMIYAVPLLKGSWLTSPYKEDGPPDRIPSRKKSGIDGDGEYNSVNRVSGSNLAKEADYNKVNRDAGSNFNQVNRDASSNFAKETDYNRVNRDAGSNFNQVNRDASSNFAKETDYNRANRDAGSNFNQVNRDASSNFAKETDYNRVNRDSGSNFNQVNRDASSNFAKETDYNRVNRDTGSNFNQVNRDASSNFAKETDYNRVNRDAGSNFNQVNKDASSNFPKETDYNRVNRDAGSNLSKAAAGTDRELDSNSTNRDANSNFAKSGSGAPREPMSGMKYHMDRNTFGENRWITEDDTKFAGICLKCHKKEHLTGTAQSASVHKTVKGWGNNKEHSFPCSKCHQAHNSGLPRLMQTNCFESGPPGLRDKSATSWQQPGTQPQTMKTGDPSGRNVGCHVKQFGKAGSAPDSSTWKQVSPW
jgi:hypothetical protein